MQKAVQTCQQKVGMPRLRSCQSGLKPDWSQATFVQVTIAARLETWGPGFKSPAQSVSAQLLGWSPCEARMIAGLCCMEQLLAVMWLCMHALTKGAATSLLYFGIDIFPCCLQTSTQRRTCQQGPDSPCLAITSKAILQRIWASVLRSKSLPPSCR